MKEPTQWGTGKKFAANRSRDSQRHHLADERGKVMGMDSRQPTPPGFPSKESWRRREIWVRDRHGVGPLNRSRRDECLRTCPQYRRVSSSY